MLYVGRLGREKGVLELLHAAARSARAVAAQARRPRPDRGAPAAPRRAAGDRASACGCIPSSASAARLARWYASARGGRHARRARDVRPRRIRGGRERRLCRDVLDGAVGRAHARDRAHVRARRHRRVAGGDRGRARGAARRRGRCGARRGAARGARRSPPRRCSSSGWRAGAPARWRSRAEPRTSPCGAAARAACCGPTGARAGAPDGRAVRLHVPGGRRATATCGTGTRASTRSPGATSTRRGRAPSCARCCAQGVPTASCRTPSSGTRRPAGGGRRCTRRAASAATGAPRRSGRRCWRSRGRSSPRRRTQTIPGFAREALHALGAHLDWLARERDPDGDGLLTIILPDESGLDDSPKYEPVFGRMTHDRAGYWRARRARPARALGLARVSSGATTTTSRTSGSTSPTRCRCTRWRG